MAATTAADPPAQRFVRLWESGASDDAARAELSELLAGCELAGRMIHGMPDEPGFGKLLSADEWKKLSWVFGPDALEGFLGQSPRGVCLRLGFGEDWLDAKLEAGKRANQAHPFALSISP